MKPTDSRGSRSPARQQFFAIALFAVLVNILFQFVFNLPWATFVPPVMRGAIETIAVAILTVPPAYYFYMRPLYVSLAERQEALKTLRKSEMHYRIVSGLTTTFVFDLTVDHEGKVSLDFISDDFYAFAGSPTEPRTFESLLGHIHPDDRGKVVDNLRNVLSKPQAAETECRAYVGDPHELRWFALYGKSEWDEAEGRIAVIYGAVKEITERKKVEEALLDSQRQIEFILGATKTGLDIIDEEFRIHYIDPQWSKVYGSWEGKKCYEYFEDRTQPCGQCSFQKALVSKQISVTEWNLAKEGNRPVQITAIPYQDKSARWLVAEVNVDITERKTAEEALRRSEDRFRRLFQFSASGMAIVSPDLFFLEANQAFCKMLGYTETELQKRTFQDVTFPEDRAQSRELTQRVLSGEIDTFHLEKRYVRKDGTLAWGLASSTLLRDSQNTPLHFVTQIQDITVRKEAEEALRVSEEKFRSIVEQSADGIVVWDQTGAIVEWNKALEGLTGRARSQVAGLPIWNIFSEFLDNRAAEPSAGVESDLKAFLRGEKPWPNERHERQFVLPDGTGRTILESTFRVRQGGNSLGVAVLSDITERKKAENDRKVAEQYLQQSQKMEAIGVLAGGIAHDFNNLLAIVYGYIDLASGEAKNPLVSEYLGQAMESIDRAKGLTQQLLTFARGGAPVKRSTPLVSLIKETSQFSVSGSSVRCVYRIPADLWSCDVDRSQIGQVIQNIVMNAVQAMPMGGTIEVSAGNVTLEERQHPTLKKGDYARISIQDRGTGIPADLLPRIFDPFFTTKTKGHGLGLAISYSIVLRHDGAIDVESELGKGSTFHVYLPACADHTVEEGEPPVTNHSGTGRVLVMDDEAAIRSLLSGILHSFGYAVVCRENGKDALDCYYEEEAGQNPFSAVILDLTVPGGMGGKEVCERLRKSGAVIPVFVTSGYSNDPVMARPTDFGFSASLGKPFRRAEVVEMLEKHMTGR